MRPTTTKPPYAPRAKKTTKAMSPNPHQRGNAPARMVAMPMSTNPTLVRRIPAWKPKPRSLNSHPSVPFCGKIPEVAWPTNASAAPAKARK
jgi:hypothetical protein